MLNHSLKANDLFVENRIGFSIVQAKSGLTEEKCAKNSHQPVF